MADQKISNWRNVVEYTKPGLFSAKYVYAESNFNNTIVQDLDFGVAIELAFMDGGGLTQPWTSKSKVHDFQLTSDHEGPLQWVAGIFDFSERQDRMMFVSYFQFGAVAFPNHNYSVDTTAGYFDTTYNLNERTQVFGGLRYTEDTKSNKGAKESRLISAACSGDVTR